MRNGEGICPLLASAVIAGAISNKVDAPLGPVTRLVANGGINMITDVVYYH